MLTFITFLKFEQAKINASLDKSISDMPEHLRPVAEHVISAGGKRLRPALALASARLFGAVEDELYDMAAIPELIHAATLLHDDVLDGAETRRGKTAAHLVHGVPQSILAGDALLAMAHFKAASFGRPALLGCVSEAVIKTAEGEAHEMARQRSLSHGYKEYIEIIAGKTGWLLSGACRLGALYAGASEKETDAVSEYGLNLGIAFQMVDDALDFADESLTGKPTAGDLSEGKCTPPVMKYLDFLPSFERDAFRCKFKEGSFSKEEKRKIAADIRRLGFDEETKVQAEQFLDKAEQCLAGLPDRMERQVLRDALSFVRKRKI